MNQPVRINCFSEGEMDSFLLEHDESNRYVVMTDVPEDLHMNRIQLVEFIRLLSIRLEKIS